MAKTKEKKVMFPSLMSMLGIGGTTKGLVGDLTKTSGKKDIAQDVDSSIMNYVTESGFFLDGSGKAYMQTGGKLYEAGEYDVDVHGLPVPLAKKNKGKNNRQQLLAGFLRPSGSGYLSNREFLEALKIINSTSPNEFIRNQRENILIQQSRFGV